VGLGALIVFAAFLARWMATDPDGYLRIVDDINLVIHEAGHPIIGILGEWPQWWGGTIMELLVPGFIAVVFWYQRSALSAAFAGIWFFENLHYIAWYMADATTEALPLAGGGEHDWNALLSHYGLLDQDTVIAAKVNTVGYVGIAVCVGFAIAVWLMQRGREQEPAEAPAPQHYRV
jgi:hypothetical protein